MATYVIPMPRAFQNSGALAPETVANFYDPGTTNPKIVYTSVSLGVPYGTSVTSDAYGVFPQVYVDGSAGVKVDYVFNGESLAGYPRDNVNGYPPQGLGADSVSFEATPRIAADDTQDAVEAVDRSLEIDEAAEDLLGSTGGDGAYVVLTNISEYFTLGTGHTFLFTANHENPGAATLQVSGTGVHPLQKQTDGGLADLDEGDIQPGHIVRARYNGTQFVIIHQSPGRATEAEALLGEAKGVYMDPYLVRQTTGSGLLQVIDLADQADAVLTLTEGFGIYLIHMANIVPATAGAPIIRFAQAGGDFRSSNGDYEWSATNNGTSETAAVNASEIQISGSGSVPTTAGGGFSAQMWVYNPLNASAKTTMTSQLGIVDGTPRMVNTFGYVDVVAEENDRMQLLMPSGNLVSGQIVLFGLI